jgi:TRAP-type C4-dicarboxylate transport system permease small subunit
VSETPSRVLQRLRTWARQLEDGLLVLLLTGMILLAGTQILLRNAWGTGLTWSDPLLRVGVLWIALLGAMAATRTAHHIRIDVLSRFLPPKITRYNRLVTDLFTAIVCLLVAWHAGRFVHDEYLDGSLLFAAVPAWACELILPVGFGVMGLRYLLGLLVRPEGPP